MDFDIGIATAADSWKLAQRAEQLGFTHAWFFDTQMIRRTSFTATEPELTPRVAALRDAGWSQLVIAIPPGQKDAIEGWARIKDAFG